MAVKVKIPFGTVSKTKVNLKIKLGTRQDRSYDLSVPRSPATREKLRKQFKQIFDQVGLQILKVKAAPVIGQEMALALDIDLLQFATQTAALFTSQMTGDVGAVIRASSLAPTRAQRGYLPTPAQPQTVIEWDALAPYTLHRKRHDGHPATQFFVGTGALQETLERFLPTVIAAIFAPVVEIRDKDGRDGRQLVSINISLFGDAEPPLAIQAAIATGQWNAAEADDKEIVELGGDIDMTRKLENSGPGHPKRPWVGPAMAYWAVFRARQIAFGAVQRMS